MFLRNFRTIIGQSPILGILSFTLFFVPLLFSPYASERFETVKFSLFIAGTGTALALFAVRRSWSVYGDRLMWLLFGLLLLLVGASAVFSSDYINSILGFTSRLNSSLILYGGWVVFVALLLGVLNKDNTRSILALLVVSADTVAVFGILQSFGVGYYGGIQTLYQAVPDRVPSLLGNPNFSSYFIACVVPCMLLLASEARSRGAKLFFYLSLFASFWALAVFSSRGAILATGAAIILWLAYLSYQRRFRLLLGVFVGLIMSLVVFWGVFNLYRPSVIAGTKSGSEENITNRMVVWDAARIMVEGSFWLGVGPGNFQTYYQQAQTSALSEVDGFFDDAHNWPLNIVATIGVPALLVMLAIFSIVLVRSAFTAIKRHDAVAAATASALVGFIIASWFNPVTVSLWMLFGVLCALGLRASDSPEAPVVLVIRAPKFARVAGAVLGLSAVVVAIGLVTSDHLTTLAVQRYLGQEYDGARDIAHKAFFINPSNQLALFVEAAAAAHIPSVDPALVRGRVSVATGLHPTTARSFLLASNVYWTLYSRTRDKRDLDSAVHAAEQNIRLAPYLAPSYTHAALYSLRTGDTTQAVRFVRQSLSLNSRQFPAWLILANIYQRQGQKPELLMALSKAADLNPLQPQLQVLVKQVERSSSDQIKAIPLFISSDEVF